MNRSLVRFMVNPQKPPEDCNRATPGRTFSTSDTSFACLPQGRRDKRTLGAWLTESAFRQGCYWTELATCEKTVFALEPMSRIVPTTITRITANITAYSAIS